MRTGLIISMVLLILFTGFGAFTEPPAQSEPFFVQRRGSGPEGTTIFQVLLEDLRFEIAAYQDSILQEMMIHSVSPPKPFLVRKRSELVPALEKSLKTSKVPERYMVHLLCFLLLPHIDDPAATELYIRFLETQPRGLMFRSLPAPQDSLPQHAWVGHLGDDRVLRTIRSFLAAQEADTLLLYSWPLGLLASTDSPKALETLRQYLEAHPSRRAAALYSGAVLGAGPPMAESPWKYFLSKVLPPLCSEPQVDANTHYTMLVLHGLCGQMSQHRTIVARYSAQIGKLGEQYLGNLLVHPNRDRIFAWPGVLDSITPKVRIFNYEEYEGLLELGQCFGTHRQVELMKSALAPFESSLFAEGAEAIWPWGHGGALSGPSYDQGVESYKKLKESALKAMNGRGPGAGCRGSGFGCR